MPAASFLQAFLRQLDPETAHELALDSLIAAQRVPGGLALLRARFYDDHSSLHTRAFDLEFPNPIGLAAGFDKNARAVPALAALGFGFIEVGGVTAEPLAGNPRPRIRREPERHALINWMGLPNDGAEVIARRLAGLSVERSALSVKSPDLNAQRPRLNARLGLNVAGETVDDYLRVLEQCAPFVDYVTLNVSCPNVVPGRQLSDPVAIRALLRAVGEMPDARRRPALLKISPDLETAEVEALTDLALDGGAVGMVATNTSAAMAAGRGGLSGAPLRERSTAVIRQIRRRAGDRLAIIGVGGVFTAEDALEKILAGASLVQVYTGFIYRGPGMVRDLKRGLAKLLARRGVQSVAEGKDLAGVME